MENYTVVSLLDTYKKLKSSPSEKYLFGPWPHKAMNFDEWRHWFISCLNNKINRHEKPRGKKDCPEYMAALRRDVRIIREYYTRQAFHSGCNILSTPEAKKRYPWIDNPDRD